MSDTQECFGPKVCPLVASIAPCAECCASASRLLSLSRLCFPSPPRCMSERGTFVALLSILLLVLLSAQGLWWYTTSTAHCALPPVIDSAHSAASAHTGPASPSGSFSIKAPCRPADASLRPRPPSWVDFRPYDTLIVLSYSKEDVTWTRSAAHPVVLIDHNDDGSQNSTFHCAGSEASAYVQFIVNNWGHLPAHMIFSHAHASAWHIEVRASLFVTCPPALPDNMYTWWAPCRTRCGL